MRVPTRRIGAAALITVTFTAAGCSSATNAGSSQHAAIQLDNCGEHVALDAPPEQAVTVNQAATEIMLSLGLADRMAGTAYLDDEIKPELAADYAKVPVLAEEYPSQESLLEVEPDFVYASYPSAYDSAALGSRDDLADLEISSYLSPAACKDKSERVPQDFEAVYREITDVGTLFGVEDEAETLVQQLKSTVSQMIDNDTGAGRTAILWDSDTATPSVASGAGMGGFLLTSAGLKNVFADETDGNYVSTSWEAIADANPDVIVLVDAVWDPAADKIAFLQSDPAASQLAAVQNQAFVTLPFVATTVGLRAVDGLVAIDQQLAASG